MLGLKLTEYVQNIPFSVCDVFDDVDDRLWSFNKLFSDVIDKNAPVKNKILKKTFSSFHEQSSQTCYS